VPPLDRQIIALVDVDALGALSAVVQGASVAGFATAIIPAGHIKARGRLVTPMQVARALVQVELAAVTDVTAPAGTPLRCHALAAVLAGLIAHGCTGNVRLFIISITYRSLRNETSRFNVLYSLILLRDYIARFT